MARGETPFRCMLCPQMYAKRFKLERHLYARHISNNFCNVSSLKNNALKRSLKKKAPTTRKPRRCYKCKTRFKGKRVLYSHLWKCYSKPEKCAQCYRSFFSEEILKMHASVHSCKRPQKCRLCAKSFTLESVLKRHMLSHASEFAKKNMKDQTIRCTYCHKYCSSPFLLKHHMRRHTG